MPTLNLTTRNVNRTYGACLWHRGELISSRIEGGRLISNCQLSQPRLEAHRRRVADLLGQLPQPFFNHTGVSLIEGSRNNQGQVWTTATTPIKKLLELGMALGYVQLLPSSQNQPLLVGVPACYIRRQVETSQVVIKQSHQQTERVAAQLQS